MALSDENGMVMPVSPMYGNGNGGFGFGGDWGWIVLLLLICNGGWGGGFGGFGGMLGYDFPWLLNGQNGINNNVSDGFRSAQLSDGITSIRDSIGNLSTQLCNCCGDMQMALANGFSGVEQSANARQIADMQQMFALQSGVQSGFNATNTGIADLKYTVATENCADRTQAMQNTRDIIEANSRTGQAILDKLCQLEMDGYKREADQLRAENSTLKNQGFIANEINQQNEVFYNRLKNCPVNTVPVFGNQPIFTCGNNGCGCNGNAFYN
jgi:hypothetical protein